MTIVRLGSTILQVPQEKDRQRFHRNGHYLVYLEPIGVGYASTCCRSFVAVEGQCTLEASSP